MELENIKNSINGQPSWILNDVKTFQFLRLNQNKLIHDNNLGGGNILSVIGLFSILNYLSKIYKILQSGKLPKLNTDSDSDKTFTEEVAFIRLLKDYSKISILIKPNQDDEQIRIVWRSFRNILSHMAQIPNGSQALVIVSDLKDIHTDLLLKHISQSNDASFTKIDSAGYVCFIDKLIADTESIKNWIIKRLDSGDFAADRIKSAHKWISENSH